jgi:hypothetical protein
VKTQVDAVSCKSDASQTFKNGKYNKMHLNILEKNCKKMLKYYFSSNSIFSRGSQLIEKEWQKTYFQEKISCILAIKIYILEPSLM